VFSIRNIIILGIVVFPSLLILILVNIIDNSFAVDFHNTLTNNTAEFENKVIKSNNPLKEDDICLRYENITKTIVVCN
jgi:hypothetical protein